MIVDLLKFTIKDGFIDAVIEHMKEQTVCNRSDEGCMLSKVFRSKKNPSELFMLLGWENPEAIEKHLQTDHDLEFRNNIDDKLACPPEFFEWETII